MFQDMISLTKPRITLMALIVAWGAMMLVDGAMGFGRALLSLFGIALLVSGSSALNMYYEREHDAKMRRTAKRALPDNRLNPKIAWAIGWGTSFLSIPCLIWGSNTLTLLLGAFSLFSYVAIYTPMKRYSAWSVIVGAVPGAMPAVLGYTAVSGSIDAVCLTLFAIAFFWQLPHVIAIGIFRGPEYTAAGFYVIPEVISLFWSKVWMCITTFCLFIASIALWMEHVGGSIYLFSATILGAWFLSASVYGFFVNSSQLFDWSRRVFYKSLIYQTGLFLALVVDVAARTYFSL